MTLQFYDRGATERTLTGTEIATGPETGFLDAYRAAERLEVGTNIGTSRDEMFNAALEERQDAIARITGKSYEDAIAPFMPIQAAEEDLGLYEGRGSLSAFQPGTSLAIKRLREALGPDRAGEILRDDQIEARAVELAQERVTDAADVAERAAGWGATFGEFAGAVKGQLHDPLVLATLPFGPSAASRLLVAVGINAALGGAVTAAQQPSVQKWRERIGLPSGVGEAAFNVAGGAASAGGVTAAFGLLAKGIGYGVGKLTGRETVQAFDELLPNPTPEQRVARDRLEAEADFAEQNPMRGDTAETAAIAEAEHTTRAAEAVRALEEEGQAPVLPDIEPELAPPPREVFGGVADRGAPGNTIYGFDPDELAVDATRFQFKTGGDAQGVTDRLAGVERFDPVKAGVVLVWEDAAGKRFIADGHQRLGLAKRAKAAGQAPKMTGYLFREADGYTDAFMRASAAAKNIAEGTGSAIDAAKVLRDWPDLGVDLPPRSALVRDAKGLAALADDAFGMVVNERVPATYAAIAGRLASDKSTHEALLKTLAETKPDSAIEAESIVRDALSAPQVREIQESLFGAEETTELLLKERAKVLAATARRFARDRAAFSVLLREAGRLEQAGNVLAREANQARVIDDAQILAILQTQARVKGPLAEALARAAKELKGGASLQSVVNRFADDARRGAAESFSSRRKPGRDGPDDEGNGGGGTGAGGGGEPPRDGGGGGAAGSPAAKGVEQEPFEFSTDELTPLTADEAREAAKNIKTSQRTREDELFARLFDAETAAKATKASRTDKTDFLDDLADTLGPEEQAEFNRVVFGIDEPSTVALEAPEELDRLARDLFEVEEGGQQMIDTLAYRLTDLPKGTDQGAWTPDEKIAWLVFARAAEVMRDRGINSLEVSQRVGEKAASRYDDPVDAEFMLERFFRSQDKGTEAPTSSAPVMRLDAIPARPEDLPDLIDPLGPEATAASQRLELNLKGEIERGNDTLVMLDDGTERPVSKILEDIDNDAAFIREVEQCL